MIHAISAIIRAMETVNTNMASISYPSSAVTVSLACNFVRTYMLSLKKGVERLTLVINIKPPAIKQNAVISSEGGRPGRVDVGGER
jgi:hypothetical protein